MWILYDSAGWVVSAPFERYIDAVQYLRAMWLQSRVVQRNPYIIRKMYVVHGLNGHLNRVMQNTEAKLNRA